jgi:hypothetical protein
MVESYVADTGELQWNRDEVRAVCNIPGTARANSCAGPAATRFGRAAQA